jgi:DNA-binding NarL/FixJ family response regulator
MISLLQLADSSARNASAPAPIRVLIADRHACVRLGLAACVRAAPDMEVAGEAESGEQVLALCDAVRPHVALIDLFLPEMDGEMVTRLVRQAYPDTKIIAMVVLDRGYLADIAQASGATDYITKDISTVELTRRIRAAARSGD